MLTRGLGSTPLRVSEIGVGTYRFTGDVQTLRRALDLGVTLIDTAEMYGNEAVVGEAVRGRRAEVVIATKLRTLRYGDVIASADASLRRLGVDEIDLYQIHFPDAAVPLGETMSALATLVAAGKVRHVGVSNFSVPELEEARRAFPHPIASNQVLYNLVNRTMETRVIPYCRQHGITVIAYSPLAQGLSQLLAQTGGALETIARDIGRTPAQVALRWCLRDPSVVVIPKAQTMAHVDENCGASGWALDAATLARLEALPHLRRSSLYMAARRFARQWRQRIILGPRA